jgi:predicted secreted protein
LRIKNILLSIFVLCAFFNLPLIAQTNFARTYGTSVDQQANDVQPTSDGGYIVAGWTVSVFGFVDAWVVKLDSGGNVQFEKAYGSSSGDDVLRSVNQTSDGGYIVAGYTTSFGAGGRDVWVMKLDSAGSVQFQKAFGGTADDEADSVVQTSDGGFVVGGYAQSFGPGDNQAWVLKLDASLNVLSQKNYSGTGAGEVFSISETTDGGILAAGFEAATSATAAGANFWLLKLDASGAVQLQESIGGDGNEGSFGAQETPDGGYILAGPSSSFGGAGFHAWIVKVSSSGAIEFQKSIGGSSDDDELGSIHHLPGGGYMTSGYTNSFGAGADDLWLLKLDEVGNIQFQKTYGGLADDFVNFHGMRLTPDGGAVLSGITQSFGSGMLDAWLLKVGSDGSIDSSCSLVGDSTATQTDTTVTAVPISTVPADTNATVTTTTAMTAVTSSTIAEQCSQPFLFSEDFDGTTPPPNWTYTQAFVENNGVLSPATKKKSTAIATPAFAGCQNCTITSSVQYTGAKSKIILIGWSLDSGNELELLMNSKKIKLLQRSNNVIVKKQKFKTPLAMNVPHTIAMSYDGTNVIVNIDGTDVFPAFTPVGTLPVGTVGVLLKGDLGNLVDYFHVN